MNGKKNARGNITELTMRNGREVAIIDSTADVKDGVLVIVYDKTDPKPAVRANEVATLLRDPDLAEALSGCVNMEQRQKALIPFCQKGHKVSGGWMEPQPEPVAPPQGSPEPDPALQQLIDQEALRDIFATKAELRAADIRIVNEVSREIERLEHELAALAPTQITVGTHEPVTLPAGEIIHEATAEIIEDLADGMHVYMTGEPGTGKSRLAMTAAKALGFASEDVVIFPVSNMDQKNSLLGWRLPTTGEYIRGPLHHAFEGKFTVLEELDAGMGAAMTAINIVLDAPFVTFPNGETLERPDQLFIVGAGNTTGKGGDMMFLRNQMDAATRNRWVFHHVTYDRNLERRVIQPILGDDTGRWLDYCWSIREAVEAERVVFSTRNIRHGAMMLRRGRDIATIVERALLPGESADIIRKSGALTNWS